MKTKNLFWAALSMTAALMMTACSNDDNDTTENPAVPSATNTSATKTIPYTVTVNDGATTRATVDANNKTLRFATGDKLYITGTNIQGVLDLQAGDEGKASGATFSGDLTYTGDAPADDLSLTATLVSAQQTVGTQVSVDAAGAVTVNYPTTAYCADVATAVQKYSRLTDTSTYGAKSFTLTQQTAFLNFEITFVDGTTTGTNLSAVVSNGGSALCTANVTTVTDNGVKAKFVLPVAKGTTLSSANVMFDDRVAISFGASQMLAGKVYNVKRTTVTWNSTTVFNDSHQGDVLNKTSPTSFLTYEGITISFTGASYVSGFETYASGDGKAHLRFAAGDSFTFTAPTGKKFTKIEINNNSYFSFTAHGGWTKPETTKIVWSGTAANTVTLGGSEITSTTYVEDLNSIVFTLVDA